MKQLDCLKLYFMVMLHFALSTIGSHSLLGGPCCCAVLEVDHSLASLQGLLREVSHILLCKLHSNCGTLVAILLCLKMSLKKQRCSYCTKFKQNRHLTITVMYSTSSDAPQLPSRKEAKVGGPSADKNYSLSHLPVNPVQINS